MHDLLCPPRRMRFSFESRCRLVALIVAGESPRAAAAACGASRATGYRLWRRYQEGGWLALGSAESLYGMEDKFETIVLGKTILYRKPQR